MKPRRRLGLLKQLLSKEDLAALTKAVEAPLSPADQAALEGKHTDGLGIARRQGPHFSMRLLRHSHAESRHPC